MTLSRWHGLHSVGVSAGWQGPTHCSSHQCHHPPGLPGVTTKIPVTVSWLSQDTFPWHGPDRLQLPAAPAAPASHAVTAVDSLGTVCQISLLSYSFSQQQSCCWGLVWTIIFDECTLMCRKTYLWGIQFTIIIDGLFRYVGLTFVNGPSSISIFQFVAFILSIVCTFIIQCNWWFIFYEGIIYWDPLTFILQSSQPVVSRVTVVVSQE